jgi:aminoglycoside 6'-N-acetyltransferase I
VIRPAAPEDLAARAEMRAQLWPEASVEEHAQEFATAGEAAFVADAGGALVGFIEIAVRSYAEGADGSAPYVEGIWVAPAHRRRGVGRALLDSAEQWARGEGHDYLGSDALLDNEASHAWHRAAGFAEVERLVVFGKRL